MVRIGRCAPVQQPLYLEIANETSLVTPGLTYYGWDTAVAIGRHRRCRRPGGRCRQRPRIFRTSKTDHPAAPNPPSNGA
jgi:hypothetical protein